MKAFPSIEQYSWELVYYLSFFFHSGLERYVHIPYLNTLLQGTYSGVDAFFLLSAMGLYFSFRKDSNILHFYKKRFIRIIPLYWIALLIKLFITNQLTPTNIFYSFTTLDFWFSDSLLNWYVPAIVFLYFLFPFYYKIFCIIPIITTTLGILISAIIAIFVLEAPFSEYKLFYFRIPIFLIGILIGKYLFEKKKTQSYWEYIFMTLGLLSTIIYIVITKYYIGLQWNGGLFYPFIFIYLGLFIFLSKLFAHGGKVNKKIQKVLNWFGTICYELYLTHIILISFAYYLISQFNCNYLVAMILCPFILAIPISYFVHVLYNKYVFPILNK